MKSSIKALAIAACSMLIALPLTAAHKYVGVTMCSMCHKTEKQGNQYGVWKASKHAEAYTVLESAKANEIAKSKGLTKPAAESPECLKCHTTAYGVDASLLMKSFNPKDGVQCETCHGPGSDYKSFTIMKDHDKAVAAGLIEVKNDPKLCEGCHNSESPTFKGFNYKEQWEKIKHPVPVATK
jgi:Cytochrome c554 and c-prime